MHIQESVDRNADNVWHIEQKRPQGDPIADYISMWMALEVFHEQCKLTEEGWSFLCEQLQRPLELRLMERRPTTSEGAVRALNMAAFIMENMAESNPWYQRLRLHLVKAARDHFKEGQKRDD